MSSKKQKRSGGVAEKSPIQSAVRKRAGASLETGLDQSFRLRPIQPLNDAQKDVFEAYQEGYHLFLYGVAGTGKSFVPLYLALQDILSMANGYRKIYIVRSSVPSRDMGFLPGKIEDKMAVYGKPYKAMVNKLFGRDDAWEIAVAKGAIELVSTSFLRGITLDECVIIFDEVQNCTYAELDTLTTRAGDKCRMIFCGDLDQNDLVKNRFDSTGLPDFIKIMREMESVEFVEFGIEDIVRGGFVKEYLTIKHRLGLHHAQI